MRNLYLLEVLILGFTKPKIHLLANILNLKTIKNPYSIKHYHISTYSELIGSLPDIHTGDRTRAIRVDDIRDDVVDITILIIAYASRFGFLFYLHLFLL